MSDQTMDAAACAAMGALAPEHEMLKQFEGTFKAAVKMWMGPGDPIESTGTMNNSLILGGRFIQHEYVGDPQENAPFPDFRGAGYWGYNTTDKRFEGVWIDTASNTMQTEQGQANDDGTAWEMHGEMTCPQAGVPMKKRSVITVNDDGTHTMEMYFTMPEIGEMKCMEIVYTRA